jgi:hypothetical protein
MLEDDGQTLLVRQVSEGSPDGGAKLPLLVLGFGGERCGGEAEMGGRL